MLLLTTHQLLFLIAHCFVNSLNFCAWKIRQALPQFLNSEQLQLEPQIPGGRHSLTIRLERFLSILQVGNGGQSMNSQENLKSTWDV